MVRLRINCAPAKGATDDGGDHGVDDGALQQFAALMPFISKASCLESHRRLEGDNRVSVVGTGNKAKTPSAAPTPQGASHRRKRWLLQSTAGGGVFSP